VGKGNIEKKLSGSGKRKLLFSFRGIKKLVGLTLVFFLILSLINLERSAFAKNLVYGQSDTVWTFYVLGGCEGVCAGYESKGYEPSVCGEESRLVNVVRVYTKSDAQNFRSSVPNILGYTISFCAIGFEVDSYIAKLGLQTLKVRQVDSIEIFYFSTPLVSNYILVGGRRVNMQLAINSTTERVTIGKPVILGSF